MIQLLEFWSNSHTVFTKLVRPDTSSTMTPLPTSDSLQIRAAKFESQIRRNYRARWFWGSTTKTPAGSVLHTRPHVLDMCLAGLQPHPRYDPLLRVLVPVSVLGVSNHDYSPNFSSPSVKTQCSSFVALGPSVRTRMTITFSVNHHLRTPHLHTTTQDTCSTNNLAPSPTNSTQGVTLVDNYSS
jgi:hypothetical protein